MKFSQQKLEEVAANSLYTTMTNSASILYSFEIFKRHLLPGSILELGPAEGLMTGLLAGLSAEVTAVDGSQLFCEQLKIKFGDKITVVNTLFEKFEPGKKYDNIILGHVLEHVSDPEYILQLAKKWLSPSGVVLSAVPNASSVHRQAAVHMGLLPSVYSMSPKDIHHGHLRIFDPETFEKLFINTGYTIVEKGGYWLKPISDKQIEEGWTPQMLNAFMQLGERYPEIAAEIYIIAKL